MKNIFDWVEDVMVDPSFFSACRSQSLDFPTLAETLARQAQAEGYSPDELDEACGSDVSGYIMKAHGDLVRKASSPSALPA
jgi:hypothetical protein